MSSSTPTTCFHTTRLNASTFVIREEDSFGENPLIYAKIYSEPPLLLLSDTGCGGHGLSPSIKVTSLRNYLETYPIPSNLGQPLNPSGKLPYFIICTHCHFDHILGIPDFVTPHSNTTILASSNEPSFITRDLPTHSLCRFLGLSTPKYEISYWAVHLEAITYNSIPLNIQILHTPGHTPDEIGWYDSKERHLYVGDSFYELRSPFNSSPIIFPLEGDWIDYMQSLRTLSTFIDDQNDLEPSAPRVRIGCAHITFSVDAAEIVREIQKLFVKIIAGKIPVVKSIEARGEICDLWMESPEAKYSVRAPRRLAEAARHFFSVNPGLLLFRSF
jgi:glyoxylase-like metal-dependent hydrolase (beta-lactamase superfamily II)